MKTNACILLLSLVLMGILRITHSLLGKGGTFAARVHPKIKQTLRGVKQESNLRREAITRFNKRWRSWSVRMVRKQVMPKQVVVTSDPKAMDGEYLATCIHQAACKNLKDTSQWKGFIDRLPAVIGEMSAEHFGYICWAVGKVQVPRKSSSKPQVHEMLIDRALVIMPALTSHGMMSLLWTLKRALVKPPDELMKGIAERILNTPSQIRPSDYISICNSLAFFGFGKSDAKFRDRISSVSLAKFESDTFAQDFRSAVDALAMVNLWNDEMKRYVLERFRKICVTARPNHLLKAYEASVAVRTLFPEVWFNSVSEPTRDFYTRLSLRHITSPSRHMCAFHKEVSELLAGDSFKVPHRNMFRWGPFYVDIGIESEDVEESALSEHFPDDRKTCLMLDKQSSYYANLDNKTLVMTEQSKLRNALLSELGWNVKHVNQKVWRNNKSQARRIELLKNALQ